MADLHILRDKNSDQFIVYAKSNRGLDYMKEQNFYSTSKDNRRFPFRFPESLTTAGLSMKVQKGILP